MDAPALRQRRGRQPQSTEKDDDAAIPPNGRNLSVKIRKRSVSRTLFPNDFVAYKLLTSITLTYLALFLMIYAAFTHVPNPLPSDAPPALFSEGRAMDITSYLADTIGDRQVSTPGEEQAAQYLLQQCQNIVDYVNTNRPDLEAAVVREFATGAIGIQNIFHFDIANAYNNLTNVVLRIAPKIAANKPGVLVNAHYDSTIGTAGASDCASCVAVALEIARTIVSDPIKYTLASPLFVLLNGGEETLMQASHGFMQSSKFVKQLGAFINLESTGPWGPDVVFQHSGDWTLGAYARAAPYPRGTTLAQDFFELKVIPADTDYRMFSYRSYGSLPGIDVATLFDGTAYHTYRDETSRIRPGTLQAMGENMLATVVEFSRVLGGLSDIPPEDVARPPLPLHPGGKVYFDLFARKMVIYTHQIASVVHMAPLIGLLALSLSSAVHKTQPVSLDTTTFKLWVRTVPEPPELLRGLGRAVLAILGCVGLPAVFGGLRVLVTGQPMIWFTSHKLANAMYLPAACAGLLLPGCFLTTRASSREGSDMRLDAYGAAFLSSIIAVALTLIGMHSAYMSFSWASSGILAAFLSFWASSADEAIAHSSGSAANRVHDGFANWSRPLKVFSVIAAFLPSILVTMASSMTVPMHVMEKISMGGAVQGVLGPFVPDLVTGAVQGAAVVIGSGSIWPYVSGAFGSVSKKRIAVLGLLLVSTSAAAYGSWTVGPVPYSHRHPKRVFLQHFHRHTTKGEVLDSLYSFASMDAIPIQTTIPPRLLEAASPSVIKELNENLDIPIWRAFYPLHALVQPFTLPAPPPEPHKEGLPLKTPIVQQLTSTEALVLLKKQLNDENFKETEISEGCKRLYFNLDTVQAAWAVLNLTGDIRAWSLARDVPTTVHTDPNVATRGSHIVRYASSVNTWNWVFSVDIPKDNTLGIELFVSHVPRTKVLQELLDEVPDWTSAMAVTTYFSYWEFV